jgi:hypothetical protein
MDCTARVNTQKMGIFLLSVLLQKNVTSPTYSYPSGKNFTTFISLLANFEFTSVYPFIGKV